MKKIYLLLWLVSILIISKAQTPEINCGVSMAMENLYKSHPKSKQNAEALNAFTREFKNFKQNKATGSYIIPVVFHVYGTNFNGATVTDKIIKDALNRTNEDFKGLTADWGDGTIIPEFDGVKKALDITFKLAQVDPDGNPTTGIVYYATKAGFGNGYGYDQEIQKDAWDNYKYMNVYIQNDLYDDGVTNNSGVAWYPDSWMSDNNLSRVVYNGAYLGNNTDENFRSVLTHEFGHWLNLAHTFEGGCPDAVDCSSSGDQICDTPPEDNYGMEGDSNCNGDVTNWQNFMTYTSNYAMYTVDQVARMEAALQHTTRFLLWQQSNLDATGVNGNLGARLLVSATMFTEWWKNEGQIDDSIKIAGIDGAKFATMGKLTEESHFTQENIPSGLSAKINVVNDTIAYFSLSGNATKHEIVDNLDKINIIFKDAAIVGGTSTLFSDSIKNFKISYIDPYQIVYEDIEDITADAVNNWKPFYIKTGDDYGAWVDNGDLRLETYKKAMVCEPGSRNISLIPENQEINTESNWVNGGDYPNEHNIHTSTYTTWDGKEAYMGFKIIKNGHPCYGWFKLKVSAAGNSFSIMEYAYNEEPYAPIKAGISGNSGPLVRIGTQYWVEAWQNDGSVADSMVLRAFDGAKFAKTGELGLDTDYELNNIPTGLSAILTVEDNETAYLILTGKANQHTIADSVINISLKLLPPAFKDAVPQENRTFQSLALYFSAPYKIVYEDIADITVNSVDTWVYFYLNNTNFDDYGAWYEGGNLRFETYTKSMVCESGTRNISKIAFDTEITTEDNWVAGGAYPDEHDLRTASYTVWDGTTAYMAFQTIYNGHPRNGWFKVSVSATGDEYTIYEYAFNEAPYASIFAGKQSGNDFIDTEAPNAPGNLQAINITGTDLDLKWTASTDNVGVVAYDIYQDDALIKSVSRPEASIANLEPNTSYTYTVKARDAANNESVASNSITETTTVLSFEELGRVSYTIYPNPASEYVTLETSTSQNTFVQLIDINGKIVKGYRLNGYSTRLDLQSVKKGIYFLKIYKTKNSLVKKLIIK